MTLPVKHLTELSDAAQKAYDATLRLSFPSDRPNLRSSIEAATVKAATARTVDEWHSLFVLLTRLQKTAVHSDRDLSSVSDSLYGAIEKMTRHFREAIEAVTAVITLLSKQEGVVRVHVTQLGVRCVAADEALPDAGSPPPAKEAEKPAPSVPGHHPAEQSGTPADHESPDAPSDETSSSSHRSVGGKRRH